MSNSKSKRPAPAAQRNPKHVHSITLEENQQRRRERHLAADIITVLMLLLTILVLAWVAYQLNNPIAIDVSRFIHR